MRLGFVRSFFQIYQCDYALVSLRTWVVPTLKVAMDISLHALASQQFSRHQLPNPLTMSLMLNASTLSNRQVKRIRQLSASKSDLFNICC